MEEKEKIIKSIPSYPDFDVDIKIIKNPFKEGGDMSRIICKMIVVSTIFNNELFSEWCSFDPYFDSSEDIKINKLKDIIHSKIPF